MTLMYLKFGKVFFEMDFVSIVLQVPFGFLTELIVFKNAFQQESLGISICPNE